MYRFGIFGSINPNLIKCGDLCGMRDFWNFQDIEKEATHSIPSLVLWQRRILKIQYFNEGLGEIVFIRKKRTSRYPCCFSKWYYLQYGFLSSKSHLTHWFSNFTTSSFASISHIDADLQSCTILSLVFELILKCRHIVCKEDTHKGPKWTETRMMQSRRSTSMR